MNYFSINLNEGCHNVTALHIYFFFLPDFFSASAIIHCSWPLTERNSSAAHFSTASIVSGSTRSRKVLVLLSFSFAMTLTFLMPRPKSSSRGFPWR